MKTKRISVITTLLAVALLLTACGAKASLAAGDSSESTASGTDASGVLSQVQATEASTVTQTPAKQEHAQASTSPTQTEQTPAISAPAASQSQTTNTATQTTPSQDESDPWDDPALYDPFQIPMLPIGGPKPKPQQAPVSSVPGRKISSATCKDTGSDEIWPDPAANALDYYEEKDPDRTAYLEYLKHKGSEYFYWIQEEDMRMYLGRNYGIPLYTSYQMMIDSTWTSSDTSVATVNQVGYVTALKEGKAVVTVTYTDPQTQEDCIRQCNITVEKKPGPFTYAELEQRAHEEAKLIANYAMKQGTTDLERIAAAAGLVNIYVGEGISTSATHGYNQPFGTLVTFYSSCAGSTRAMGLILEYMGFEWYHMGESQWNHQWCIVYDVDGQTAFADGSVLGMAGYGTWQGDGSNWRQYKNGSLVSVDQETIRNVQAQTILP